MGEKLSGPVHLGLTGRTSCWLVFVAGLTNGQSLRHRDIPYSKWLSSPLFMAHFEDQKTCPVQNHGIWLVISLDGRKVMGRIVHEAGWCVASCRAIQRTEVNRAEMVRD